MNEYTISKHLFTDNTDGVEYRAIQVDGSREVTEPSPLSITVDKERVYLNLNSEMFEMTFAAWSRYVELVDTAIEEMSEQAPLV